MSAGRHRIREIYVGFLLLLLSFLYLSHLTSQFQKAEVDEGMAKEKRMGRVYAETFAKERPHLGPMFL